MAIPVYLFAGFLESGKTSFIAGILQDPSFTQNEHTLIVQCEEGIEEYEPAMLEKTHSVVECIEDEDEYNEQERARKERTEVYRQGDDEDE